MPIHNIGLRRAVSASPPPVPTQSYNFLTTPSVPSGLTFTRASTGRYTNSSGVLSSAATDTARFDYDAGTLQLRGLLMEATATNLWTYSEALDDASWSKGNVTVTANATAAPDGTTTADKIVESAVAGEHLMYKGITIASGDTISVSAYVKASGRTKCYFLVDSGTPYATVSFDLTAKTATLNYRAQSGSGISAVSGSVQNAGNGFVRVCATFATTGLTTISVGLRLIDGSNAYSYTGDGTSGIFAWGMQVEKGMSATSYIATTTAAATRAADLCSGLTSGLAWFNATQGTILIDTNIAAVSIGGGRLWSVDDTSAANVMASVLQAGGTYDTLVTTASVAQAAIVSGVRGTVTQCNVVSRYKANTFGHRVSALNNSMVQEDTSGTIPTVTRFRLGGNEAGLLQPNGVIRRLQYWNTALTNAQIRSLR